MRKRQQAGVAGRRGDDAVPELAHGAVHHGVHIVAPVEHPDVAELFRTLLERLAVAVDRVIVQIEGDVVGADDDADVGAVDEVLVEGRVGGDRVAALRLLDSGCLASAEDDDAHHGQGQDQRKGDERRVGGVEAKLGLHRVLPMWPRRRLRVSGRAYPRQRQSARLGSDAATWAAPTALRYLLNPFIAATIPTINNETSRIRPTYSTVPCPRSS